MTLKMLLLDITGGEREGALNSGPGWTKGDCGVIRGHRTIANGERSVLGDLWCQDHR